jgi:hypothetical protein
MAAGMLWARPAAGQRVAELGVQALVTTANPALAAAGVYGALRVSQRVRFCVTGSGGVAAGDVAGRGELLGHFLFDPTAPRGAGAYAGGGVGGVVGALDEGYLVLLLGVEARPGGRSGWSAELGIGGGLRIAAGYRWRRHPGPAAW